MVYRTAPFSMTLKDPIPRFQGQAIFDAEYLQNGCRYGHSYYGRRIGNRTQAFEWHQFQWPWETSKSVFKVTTLRLVEVIHYTLPTPSNCVSVTQKRRTRLCRLTPTCVVRFEVTIWTKLCMVVEEVSAIISPSIGFWSRCGHKTEKLAPHLVSKKQYLRAACR